MLSKKLICLVLFISLASQIVAKEQTLPDLGANAQASASSKEENLLGQVYMQYLRHANKVSSDSVINSYLSNLGHKLVVASGAKAQKFNFFAVNEDDINAYAFFGGNVGIHLGLIINTDNESELAAVIAHEISHINQKHLNRHIAEQKKLMPLTIAGAIGAVAAGNPELGMAALAGHAQHMINFTREHEKEADYLGMQTLYNAGYDPEGMPNIFSSMQSSSRYQMYPPEYLLTHPLYESRISDAKNRADQFPYKQVNNDLTYDLIKARSIILTTKDYVDLEKKLLSQLKTGRYKNQTATKYTYALCLNKLHKNKQAQKILLELSKQHPENLVINLSLADLQTELKNLPISLDILKSLYALYPNESAVMLSFAEKLLLSNNYHFAKKILIRHTTLFPQEPQGFEFLAQAENKLHNIRQMHLAKSKWYILNGELENAVLQVELALQNTKDPIIISKLKKEKQSIESLIQMQQKL
jgi:beta-barrel assembly-enhancing protease